MNKFILFCAFLLPLTTAEGNFAYAQEAAAKASPYALTLPDGKVFPPECFLNNIGGEDSTIFPSVNCVDESYALIPQEHTTPESDFVATSFTYDDNVDKSQRDENGQVLDMKFPGWIGYKNFGKSNGKYLILTVENGGGTGYFHTLALYDLGSDENGNPSLVQTAALAGGDRCNGGINAVGLNGNTISYEQNITPYDLLALPYPTSDSPYASAYDEVEACAMCCMGVAKYKDGALYAVSLNTDYVEDMLTNSPESMPKQQCYAQKLNALIKDKKLDFTLDEMKALVAQVETDCLK